MKKTTKLALLFGMKKQPKQGDIPKLDENTQLFGTFPNIQAATDYANAGGVPDTFPYYGIGLEEGGFWVVGSTEHSEDEFRFHNPAVEFTILDGPFDNPGEAVDSWVRTDTSGWKSVTIQCTSKSNSDACPTAERKILDAPDFKWAAARLPRWEKSLQSLGGAAITLAETRGFMEFVQEWANKDPDTSLLNEEVLDVAIRVKKVHEEAHAISNRGRQLAKAREGRN